MIHRWGASGTNSYTMNNDSNNNVDRIAAIAVSTAVSTAIDWAVSSSASAKRDKYIANAPPPQASRRHVAHEFSREVASTSEKQSRGRNEPAYSGKEEPRSHSRARQALASSTDLHQDEVKHDNMRTGRVVFVGRADQGTTIWFKGQRQAAEIQVCAAILMVSAIAEASRYR